MEEFGMREYQISLDGDWEWHDRTRRRADGAGTFDKIWKNIVLLNELRGSGKLHKTVALVRLHVHPRNVESVERLVRLICQHLDRRFFTVVFRPIAHLGGPSDDSFDVFDPKGAEWEALHKRFSEQLPGFIAKEDDMPSVCYAGKANNFVIRSDGGVAKCTVALYSGFNLIGRLRPDGSMDLDHNRLVPWLHALRSMNEEDLSCPLSRLPVSDERFHSRRVESDN